MFSPPARSGVSLLLAFCLELCVLPLNAECSQLCMCTWCGVVWFGGGRENITNGTFWGGFEKMSGAVLEPLSPELSVSVCTCPSVIGKVERRRAASGIPCLIERSKFRG